MANIYDFGLDISGNYPSANRNAVAADHNYKMGYQTIKNGLFNGSQGNIAIGWKVMDNMANPPSAVKYHNIGIRIKSIHFCEKLI